MSSSYLDYNYITNSEIINVGGKLELPNGVIQEIKLDEFSDFDNDYYSKYNMGTKIPFLVERKLRFRNEILRGEDTPHNCSFGNYTFGSSDKNGNDILAKNDYQSINFNNYILDNIINQFSYNIDKYSSDLFGNIITEITKFVGQDRTQMFHNFVIKNNQLLEREEERLHNEKLKHQKIYGTKYYDTKSLEFKSNLLVNSIFLVACIVVISILEKNGIIAFGYVINGILIIILAIYLSLSLYDLRDRQFSNWDKKYFHYAVDSDTV
tara:strand:+ start:651 stop:1448 length:798 start_codon:yes stop_codon:yes gene_type:complete